MKLNPWRAPWMRTTWRTLLLPMKEVAVMMLVTDTKMEQMKLLGKELVRRKVVRKTKVALRRRVEDVARQICLAHGAAQTAPRDALPRAQA